MSGLNFQPTLILSANSGPNLNILGICVQEYWCGADLVHEVANFITSANIKKRATKEEQLQQSWARDKTAATTWPCLQVTQMLAITLCLYS